MVSAGEECDIGELGEYNYSLHILGLFLVLACGGLGSVLPIIIYHFKNLRPHENIIIFSNLFGAGVVISTAFIHMMLPAIENLTNECLGEVVEEFEPLALVIVMGSIFLMHFIEFTISNYHAREENEAIKESEEAVSKEPNEICAHNQFHHNHLHHHHHHKKDYDQHNRIGLVLFELGIALHSVIMGLSLGVLRGSDFTIFLVALCFHQFFEGFALGSAVTTTEPSKGISISTVLGFTLVTPIGVAIGIGVNSTFNENSQFSLWIIGISEALAAGALIYTGLIELLTMGFTLNPTFKHHNSKPSTIVCAFAGLYCGAATMAVIGKWA